jgi:transposase
MPDTSVRFTEERRAAFLEALQGGQTQAQACKSLGVGKATVSKWLSRGRKAESGEAFEFAKSYDAVKPPRRRPVPAELVAEAKRGGLSEAQLVGLLEEAAVQGNVQAMKYLLERPWERKREDESEAEDAGTSIFDELSALRERKTAS